MSPEHHEAYQLDTLRQDQKDGSADSNDASSRGVLGSGRDSLSQAEAAQKNASQYPGPAAMAVIMTAISMGMFVVSLVSSFVGCGNMRPTLGWIPYCPRFHIIMHVKIMLFFREGTRLESMSSLNTEGC